jgi:tyrosine-protein kinase Tec
MKFLYYNYNTTIKIIYIIKMLQGAEYEVLDDSQEHWWKVKNEQG